MEKENICSLCLAITLKKSDKPFLFRIADVVDGKLIPFSIDSTLERGYENIDLIYNPQVPTEGSVGFWDWHSEDTWRQRSSPNSTYRWIEYIKIKGTSNTNEVISELCSEIKGVTHDHDYLFESEKFDDGSTYCLFVKGTDLEIKLDGAGARIKDDIYFLNAYGISREDVREIKTWHYPSFSKWYYCNELSENTYKECIRSVDSIIKTLILSRINSYTPDYSKSDKSAVRNFLNFIPETPLVDMLAEKLSCDKVMAQSHIDSFLKTCELYFSCDDYDARIAQRLISSNIDIAIQFKEQVKEEWERQNKDEIEKTNAVLINLQSEISTLQRSLGELKEEKDVKEKEIAELAGNYKNLQQTANAIEQGIKERINSAAKDVAGFFAEYALFLPQVSIATSEQKASHVLLGKSLSEDPEIIDDLHVLHDCLQDNLNISGIDRELCKPLAAYLLAAYFSKIPLILSGYGADLIIDALSATLTNKKAHRIFNSKSAGEQVLTSFSDGDVIAVYNSFDMVFIRQVDTERPSLYVSLISTTAEELSIEPRGIYNYALPLFAEYFVTTHKKDDDIEGFISNVEPPEPENNTKRTDLPGGMLPVFAHNQTKRLMTAASQIYPDIKDFDFFLLLLLPVMLALGNREGLSGLILKANISDKEKEQLKKLSGELNE